MGRLFDFFDGPIADRVIAALQNCSAATMIELRNKGKLRFDLTNYIINYRSLQMEYLSDYSNATSVSARYFLYGSAEPVLPGISDKDAAIISMLDSFSDDILDGVLSYVERFFPNRFNEESKAISCPSRRMTSYISVIPKGLLAFSSSGDLLADNISAELQEEMKRYRAAGQSKLFVFDSNLWPELAEFVGVSLHWLLSLSVPLYCKTVVADTIFDRYTLMQKSEREQFYIFLEEIDANLSAHQENNGGHDE